MDPTPRLSFLGIELDTTTMCKRLPFDKMPAVEYSLVTFSKCKSATKKQLHSLAEKLSWAAGWNSEDRRIKNAISTLTATSHTCITSHGMILDIGWWNSSSFKLVQASVIYCVHVPKYQQTC